MYFTVIKKRTLVVAITLVLIGLALISGAITASANNAFLGFKKRSLPIYRVDTAEKKIAISFDCAWGVDYTDELLSVMRDKKVRCTFFTVEFWAKKHPDYVKKIFDAGHEIGTHSATHPYMSKLDKSAIIKELSSSRKAISDVTGKEVELFRAPYGDYNDLLIDTAKELGLFTIQWDVDSLDWKDISANEIKQRVVGKIKPGSIVLFHNQGKHTAEALPAVIDACFNLGYEFVPIGELIYRDGYYMGADGAQIRN